MPYPPDDGGAQVMHFTTRGLLANNLTVKILAMNPTRRHIPPESLPAEYKAATTFECVTVDTRVSPIRFLTNLFRKESYFIERFISKEFEAKLISLLEAEPYDIIQLEHLYLCRYLETIKKYSTAKLVLRPQNVEYVIWERYLKSVRHPVKKLLLEQAVKRLKKYEQKIVRELDGIIPLTREDAALFASFAPVTPMVTVPMGYDHDGLNGYDQEIQYRQAPVAYHLASMDWLPNVEAVQWFINRVVPLLEEKHFPARIVLAGRKMPAWVFQHASDMVDVVDEVSAPLKFQEEKRIMIVPLWSGSGIRAKIIEGLALGKTIISTSIGAQGIEYQDGVNILIADTPVAFADRLMQCVTDIELCRNLGKQARILSEERYHYVRTASRMKDFYNQLPGRDG